MIAPDVKQLAALSCRARAPVRSSSRGGHHVRLNGTFGRRIVRARPPQSGRAAALRFESRGDHPRALRWTVSQHLRARPASRHEHVTLTSGAAALAVTRFAPFCPEAVRPTAGMAACARRHAKANGSIKLLRLGDGVRSRSRELRSGTGIKISWSKRSGQLRLGTHLMRDCTRARVRAYS